MDPAAWEQAKGIIFEAFQRPAGEREALVRQRCGGTPLCDEILSLLSDADDPTTVTEHTWRAHLENRSHDTAPALKIGAKVGPYEIVGELGRGGMGQVFLGKDPRLQRRVALKCLLDSREKSADVRSRILHEARAAARITSQHVATIHDVIEHEGRAFIVMEYVNGEPLAARLKGGRLPIPQVITIGRQLASALVAAHAEGIVHCDLKPGNVQVMPSGVVKVLDFGIASASRLLSTTSFSLLETGVTISPRPGEHPHGGTPPYMSPEQIGGRDIDHRSDIYSLGVILFELSTGQRPFPGSNVVQIAEGQTRGVPAADKRDAHVPPPLSRVIARAMSLNADDRYQSALDIGAALESVERALLAPPLTPLQRLKRWTVRAAIVTAVTVLALAIIGLITSVQFNFVFGRDGESARFGQEPWSHYLAFGFLAAFPNAVVILFATAAGFAAWSLLRLLGRVPPFNRLLSAGRRAIHGAGLDRSGTLAQVLASLGLAALLVFFWHHEPLIHAWSSFFNSAPIEQLMPMTDSAPARNEYHIELDLLTLVFSYGLYRVIQLRRREHVSEGRVATGMLIALITIMVALNVAPYRTFQRRDFERVDHAGSRCYIIGESGDEFLILCPGNEPPRNRTIRRDDAQLRRLGIVENVFKGIPTRSTAQ